MASISTHTKSLDEILNEANEAPDPSAKLKKYLIQPYVKQYLQLAVCEEWTSFDVDDVKYKEYEYPRSLCGAHLLNARTFSIVSKIFMELSVSDRTKRLQYKALMEMLYSGEAALLKAILTKNVSSLYPNITFELLNEVLNETV